MMALGALSAQLVRTTYLRGIDLGAAWQGSQADAAINQLLYTELARAEELMAVHFPHWRVAAPPDAAMVEGTDYDVAAQPLPYAALTPEAEAYRLTLWHHDVQAITRVRLWTGMSGGTPPAPVYQELDLTTLRYDYPEETLLVPGSQVPLAPAPLGWGVDYLVGVGRLPASVVQWCSLGVAIQVLALGGAAADVSHGLGAETLRMDGIEESFRYGGGGEMGKGGGMYGKPIAILQEQRDDIDLVKLRFRYQGSHMLDTPPPAVYPQMPPRV